MSEATAPLSQIEQLIAKLFAHSSRTDKKTEQSEWIASSPVEPTKTEIDYNLDNIWMIEDVCIFNVLAQYLNKGYAIT